MNNTRQPVDARAGSLMLLMCVIMAFGQITLKYTATDMSPTLQIALRSGGAAGLIVLMAVWQRQPLFMVQGGWLPGIVAGGLFASEFFLVGEALRYTTASHVIIFLYTAPIFAALGLHFLIPAERLNRIQWSGVILAFIGLTISFLGRDASENTATSPNMLLGDILAIGAGLLWGLTTVVVRSTRLKTARATETLLYQLIMAFVVLGLGTIFMGQTTVTWTLALSASLFYQAVILSYGALLLWFWLLRKYLASRLGVLSFMTPLFGVIFGAVLLDEVLDKGFLLGAVCVIMGFLLVSAQEWLVKHKPNNKRQ